MTAIALKLSTALTAPKTTKPARRFFFPWELAGALTLMGSSAAYAVFALAHLV